MGLEYGGEPTLKADNEAFISLITTRVVPAEVRVGASGDGALLESRCLSLMAL